MRPLVLLALVYSLSGCACSAIEPGEVGVLWKGCSGGTVERPYTEGWEWYGAWNKLYVYDLKTLEASEDPMEVLTINGLDVRIDVSARWRIVPEEVVTLAKELGPDYHGVVISPTLRSVVREVVGRFTPEEVYSTKREAMQKAIFDETAAVCRTKHIILEAVLIRDVTLPEKIKMAIQAKLDEEQAAKRMEFTLARSTKEAEKKIIEAKATAEANRIVAESLSPTLLKWEGLKATSALATSANAKIVVVGSTASGGLPLMIPAD